MRPRAGVYGTIADLPRRCRGFKRPQGRKTQKLGASIRESVMISGYMTSQSGPPNVISLCERRSSAGLGDGVHFSGTEAKVLTFEQTPSADLVDDVSQSDSETAQQRDAWRDIALEYKALADAHAKEAAQARANAQTAGEVMRDELAGRTASSRAMWAVAGMFVIGRLLR